MRRGRRGRPAAQVVEDLVDHAALGNAADDAHRVAAAGTPERVHLEDPAQQGGNAPVSKRGCRFMADGLDILRTLRQ
jgi:hypothetical protein